MPAKLKKFTVYLMRTTDIFKDVMAVDEEAACKQTIEDKIPNIFSDLPWRIEAQRDESEG